MVGEVVVDFEDLKVECFLEAEEVGVVFADEVEDHFFAVAPLVVAIAGAAVADVEGHGIDGEWWLFGGVIGGVGFGGVVAAGEREEEGEGAAWEEVKAGLMGYGMCFWIFHGGIISEIGVERYDGGAMYLTGCFLFF